jgi:predicted nucleic acid-binding OB-fold protein
VPEEKAKRILDFLNSVKTAEEVADAVEFPGERDVGVKTAQNILDARNKLGRFTDLKQVDSVLQVGPERFTEIVKALG